jgi:uncharacterized protein
MKLRGHHLFCLLGFQGHGYSASFIEKMNELSINYWDLNQDFPIKITTHTDQICRSCPYIKNEDCGINPIVDRKLREMDNRILHFIGLEPEHIYNKSFILDRISKNVKPDDLDVLCKGCVWKKYGVCKEAIANLNKKLSL